MSHLPPPPPLTVPHVLCECSLARSRSAEQSELSLSTERSTTATFPVGHLGVPFRFDQSGPSDGLCPPMRTAERRPEARHQVKSQVLAYKSESDVGVSAGFS